MSDEDWRALAREVADTGDLETAERLVALLRREDRRGGPILRATRFCAAFDAWAGACSTALPGDGEETKKWREEFARHWRFIHLALTKSNLLHRLIYLGEKLRTRQCPVHMGRWSGCGQNCICNSGMNVTGWLPNDDDELAKSHVPADAKLAHRNAPPRS